MKVNLIVDQADIRRVALALTRVEDLQLIEPEVREETAWHELAEKLGRLEKRLQGILAELGIEHSLEHYPEGIELDEDTRDARELLRRLEQPVEKRRQDREEVEEQIERLEKQAANSRWLETLGLSPSEIGELGYLEIRLGWIPSHERGRADIPLRRTPMILMPLFEESERVLIAAATVKDRGFILNRVLQSIFFQQLHLSETAAKSAKTLRRQQDRLQELKNRQQEMAEEAGQLIDQWGEHLVSVWRRIQFHARAARLIDRYARHKHGRYFLSSIISGENRERLIDLVQEVAQHPLAIFVSKSLQEQE